MDNQKPNTSTGLDEVAEYVAVDAALGLVVLPDLVVPVWYYLISYRDFIKC